jgi:hypothetical protein
VAARIEMPSTATSTFCALIRHWDPISLGPALAANSLCPWKERRTMCELGVQIENSG